VGEDPPGLLHAVESIPVPAPELLDGPVAGPSTRGRGHTAYLLGQNSFHGWWYFFPVALAFKTPLALLLLAAIGSRQRKARVPAVLAAVILLVNLPTA